MTQEEFDKLPMILTRAQVSKVLGVGPNQIKDLINRKKLQTLAEGDSSVGFRGYQRRVTKESVAKLCGLSS
jgi:hypothetical protein